MSAAAECIRPGCHFFTLRSSGLCAIHDKPVSAVPVEGDRERLVYVDPINDYQRGYNDGVDATLRAGVSLTGSGLREWVEEMKDHECWDGDNFIARPFEHIAREYAAAEYSQKGRAL